ncbi:hypothetical protein ABFS82_02G110200 [Erythranthe guttata]|uniref:Uncharacterized protein n=1 Tax=Erythranthe guttata TaxID=4155 RepID=A0A022RE12_ERYGU|nr:PREDICTED: uncharacterized protein LOC105957062 [Erythranthe guttata]EYU38289.1 hypothetical protein MIMGU_mgv1a015195mg [Erythranthe guttata]|eukprot:XP_012836435.1 PREDICTED: uncharacterized protein LOC105957062 [Erythranthe guttata]
MAAISGSILNFSGFKSSTASAVQFKPPFPIRNDDMYRFRKFHSGNALVSTRIPNSPTLYFRRRRCSRPTRVLSAGRNYQLNQNDDFWTEPFWLNPIREAFWNTRSLLLFLIEQPGQLKYIEWPSFQSTLKTATLTLVLVAMLIVALSSVDSALSFLLAFFLRRKA